MIKTVESLIQAVMKMLDNDIFDEACNIKACKYDNRKCFICSIGCIDSIKGLASLNV
jgi:hypothetical protein